jgi:hypothetical protein
LENKLFNFIKMESIQNFIDKYGIRQEDLYKGFLISEGVGFVMYGSILTLCYRYSPLYNSFKTAKVQQFMTRYPTFYNRIDQKMNTHSEKLINYSLVKKIVNKTKIDPSRLLYSFCETEIVCILGTPILLPMNLWITFQFLKKPIPSSH